MEIIGTVVKTDGDEAIVSVKRVSACGENCANCAGVCETTNATTVVKNTADARVGDTVKIESESADVIRAAVVLYIVPVVVTILIAALVYGFGGADVYVFVFSAVGFFGSFLGVKFFEKKITPKSQITKIIKKA